MSYCNCWIIDVSLLLRGGWHFLCQAFLADLIFSLFLGALTCSQAGGQKDTQTCMSAHLTAQMHRVSMIPDSVCKLCMYLKAVQTQWQVIPRFVMFFKSFRWKIEFQAFSHTFLFCQCHLYAAMWVFHFIYLIVRCIVNNIWRFRSMVGFQGGSHHVPRHFEYSGWDGHHHSTWLCFMYLARHRPHTKYVKGWGEENS